MRSKLSSTWKSAGLRNFHSLQMQNLKFLAVEGQELFILSIQIDSFLLQYGLWIVAPYIYLSSTKYISS
jgi:hypothetical protein